MRVRPARQAPEGLRRERAPIEAPPKRIARRTAPASSSDVDGLDVALSVAEQLRALPDADARRIVRFLVAVIGT